MLFHCQLYYYIYPQYNHVQEKFEDTTGVKRSRKSMDRQYNGQKTDNKMVKRQTIQWPKEK